MVTVKYLGETGNRMFQYAYARMLAMKTNSGLSAQPPHESFINAISFGDDSLGNQALVKYDNCDDIYECPPMSDILVYDFMQRSKFYEPYREDIKKWFGLPEVSSHSYDVVVHIRRGDYLTGNIPTIKFEYYTDILKGLKYRNAIIIGRGIDQDTKRAFNNYRPVYTNGDVAHDMALMYGAKRIIMSNSTFAWWGTFLSDAEAWYPEIDIFSEYGTPQDLHMSYNRVKSMKCD